jgi:hypothetical protein
MEVDSHPGSSGPKQLGEIECIMSALGRF